MFAQGKPEDAFYVKCSEETNPPEAVERGILTCEIGVAPAVPAEFIMISLVERMNPEE
jgi:phage tail sheath protein FI